MPSIVFMGTPEFAVPSLEALHASGFELRAVVTNRDKRRGRGSDLSPSPVKRKALELGHRIVEIESTSDPELAGILRYLEPDLIVVVAFRILPREILEIPGIGSINLHASLLPKYRGAAPIHWAVMNGEKETGCSVFFLKERVDAGNVIRQIRTRIGPDETAGDLYERLRYLGAELLVDSIRQIERGDIEGVPQDESEATPAPKLFRKDARIDLTRPCGEVHNRIRGLSPNPCGWLMYGDRQLNLYRSRVGPEIDLQPGEMLFAEGRYLLVGCGSGSVELRELQLPGKSRISGRDFANGHDLSIRLT